MPEPLEIGFRWSEFRPDDSVDASDWRELTFAVNWFFADHDNKITAEYAVFRAQAVASEQNDGRFRVQWDIQF